MISGCVNSEGTGLFMGRKTRSAQNYGGSYICRDGGDGGDILKADSHAFHDTIGHVFAISGAMIYSGCVDTRVAFGATYLSLGKIFSSLTLQFHHRYLPPPFT